LDALGDRDFSHAAGLGTAITAVRTYRSAFLAPRAYSVSHPQCHPATDSPTKASWARSVSHHRRRGRPGHQRHRQTLEIVSADVGNPAFNVIPAEARARFNIRFNDLWTPKALAVELRRRLDSVGMKFTRALEPCNAPTPDSFTKLVTDAVERKTGRPALSTSGGTSDARFIRAYCPVVEFGLIGATVHMVDEHVAAADIEALTEIMGRYWRSISVNLLSKNIICIGYI
jgi:acetylornithine deacetylase/succinyl-diaminopimelate desuccinylase-like protein